MEQDLDKKWFDATIKYVEKLSVNNENWDALTEEEQDLAALWKLEADMYNGGFIQFFCNNGYKCYLYAIRCLEKLNAMQALDIIKAQYGIMQRLENDKRIKELWDIPKYLTEKELTKISDELDVQYWDNTDNIVEKTFNVYANFLET